MSASVPSPKTGATFVWVLGAFIGFAVLLYVIQALGAKKVESDPRLAERVANSAEINKAQGELIAKMGLNDAAKRDAIFTKTPESLGARKAAVSIQVVPGSPTQLKQAAAVAPAPAPAATGATPAVPAAPAAPGTK